ncbi:protein-disulfide reductase DsbD family protein [Wenyingzhuangia marina]|uniref:Thiol:disulfide interchange protein DsbD n=1 Tax=Wenyingzhuangia marina TaxID=1195760 RepID=A0A1M5W1C7_9FLAO|nr:thioredoxin family protein [Wenyingzhuangia marina]GGF76700.1 thiol:disulfide interchange protein DsbD [Wenyingzhuangia marina]SHH81014.1 Thiol:disulfide interchange protein DsbD [Wenyingzhuangia marina]
MKTSLSLIKIAILFVFCSVNAQVFNPVSWSTSVEKTDKGNLILVSTATIEKGWHLYSQNIGDGGPIPTTFYYPESIEKVGETIEGNGVEVQDPIFEMPIKYFGEEANFRQTIKNNIDAKSLKASVEYMVCNDEMCLPPKEVELTYDLTKVKAVKTEVAVSSDTDDKSYLTLFLLSFLAGLAALFTPCVFPMIPMTVSFFTKQSKNKAIGIRNAMIYGISIIGIYVLLGTLVVWVFGPESLNRLSTSVGFNVVFFGILVFFALSFLGAYELVLPSSWGTKLDEKADRGGVIGIFFMALALVVVSFSCTGPIVGGALVEAASHGGIAPIISMLGFSLAIAIPFTLFAVFPGWLNSLPKSGGWLNTVKVVLGFLELALAFKFLSNADLVLQAHWLEREVFIAIWIVIFLLLGVYLLGKIRLPHDYQAVETISVTRLMLAILSFTFVVYMIPGMFGAPVKLIGAFVPPLEYSESPNGVMNNQSSSNISHQDLPEGAHILAPYNILTFNDYEKGLAYAKKVNKPVLLDFTGRACVNCRKMEQNVWTVPAVLDVLQNKVVLVSLYVDDRQKLEIEEISPVTGKPYRNIGQKWSEFQTKRYKTNSQPYYVVVNAEGKDLNKPVGYTPNADEYLSWLQEGVKKARN